MPRQALTRQQKFDNFARVGGADECWNWTGYISDQGYGLIRESKSNYRAHRFSYEQYTGPIPEGKVLDHKCRNRKCVNPHHLEPVTIGENVMRGDRSHINSKKDKCMRGHIFAETGAWYDKDGHAKCKACNNLRVKGKLPPLQPKYQWPGRKARAEREKLNKLINTTQEQSSLILE